VDAFRTRPEIWGVRVDVPGIGTQPEMKTDAKLQRRQRVRFI
jgi:hypothetical protein